MCHHSALTPPPPPTARTPEPGCHQPRGQAPRTCGKARALLLPRAGQGLECLHSLFAWGQGAGGGGGGPWAWCPGPLRLPGLGAQAQLSPQLAGQRGRRRDPLAEMGNPRAAPIQQRPLALTCPLTTSRPLPCIRLADWETPAHRGPRPAPPPPPPPPPPNKPGASQPDSEIMQIPGGSLIKSLTRRWGRARGGAESRGHAPEGPGPSATGGPRAPPGAWEPPRRRRGGPAGPPRPPRDGASPRGRGRTCGPACGLSSRGRRGRGRGGRGSGPLASLSDACCWANSRGRGRLKGPD